MPAKKSLLSPRSERLENGVLVATEFLPHVRSASLGVYLDTGSRDESPATNGLAHFFEHMVFKGTPRLGPLEIVRRFEDTGGQVNAYTSKEQTCFYGKVVDTEIAGALDALLDMVFAAKFDAADVEKEKDVVIEEIRSVNDNADEYAYEMFSQAAFGTHALGRPIAGTEKSVRGLSRDLLRKHRDSARLRVPAAVVAVGRVDHAAFVKAVRKYFRLGDSAKKGAAEARKPLPRAAAAYKPKHLMRSKDVQQATVLVGGAGVAWNSPDRYPLLLLHCALGDGMSSRLFQNLREKHGLVYNIFTAPEFMSHEGLFAVGFATEPRNLEKAVKEIGRELARLRDKGLTAAELKLAKENVKGGILLGLESSGSRMAAIARRLLGDFTETPEEVIGKVDAVTRADILRCSRAYLKPSAWASSAVVPKGFKADLGKLLAKA